MVIHRQSGAPELEGAVLDATEESLVLTYVDQDGRLLVITLAAE